MALVVKDRVRESTTTTGTGTYTLAGATPGFQSFSVIGDGNTTYYAATDGTDWEVGIGTYTASGTTLARTTILESSNSGSAVNWIAGEKDIFVTYPAERSVYLNAAGLAVDVLDIGTLGTSTANISTANITAGTVSTAPTSDTDIANKLYVDNLVVSGVHFHEPVRVESPINLNATYNNGTSGVGATLTNAGTQAALVIDGVTLSVSDRVLIYQQTNQVQNGIYVVTNVGSGSTNWVLTRATDADSFELASPNGLSEGSTVFVQQGATGAGETYTCNTTGTITFGTTNITFAQISSAQIYTAGTGLTLTGTQFSVTTNGITNTLIRQSGALSVIGRSANSTGDVADISAGTDNQVLRRSGTSLGFGAVNLASTNAVTGTLPVGNGGTGQTTYTNGQLLIGNSSGNTLAKATLTAGTGIAITNGAGSITVAATNNGTVTSVDVSGGTTGLTTSGGPITGSGTITIAGTLAVANGGTGGTTQSGARTGLGATTLGSNLFTITNPDAVTFPRFNADNTVSSLSDSDFRTAIGAGTGSVTSVAGTGTANGLTLSGTVTSSGNLTLSGTSYTANNVLLGNGTSAFQTVAPGSSGNVLTSDGTTWISAAPSGGTITIDNKTGAYTVISSDNGKVINCTANTFTVSLTAAASLGAGFNVSIWNTGTGTITIDPAGSETVDGTTTRVLRPGEGTQIICTGTNWQTGNKKTMRGYAENISSTTRPTASGTTSLALLGGSASALDAQSFGTGTQATANYTTAIGRSSVAQGDRAIGIGWLGSATATDAIAIGDNQSAEQNTITMGRYARVTERGRMAINTTVGFGAPNYGAVQMGFMMLIGTTGNATPTILNADGGGAATVGNTFVVGNNSARNVRISVIGRQEGVSGSQTAAYEFTAVVSTASFTTTLLASTKTVLFETTPGWDCNISVNAPNNALDVTVTGAASTAIRWAAKIESIEINAYL
jgi:hypothetical protein